MNSRTASFCLVLLATSLVFAACASSESDPAATPSGNDAGLPPTGSSDSGTSTADAATEAAAAYVEPDCALRDDSGGPGQYADTCVRREWIQAYAGTYASAACELTIDVTGSVAATFTIKVLSGDSAGTYTLPWAGGSGAGNDSYYRFTTDATFATTKTLNFNAGDATDTGERNANLRVENLDTGTPVLKGSYQQIVSGKTDEVDCGTYTKK